MEDKREHSKRYKISSLTNIEESISIEGFNEKISTSDI